MAYSLTSTLIGAQPITAVNDVQMHPVGTRVTAFDPTYDTGEFIYLPGVAALTAGGGDIVVYDEKANTTVRCVAASRGPIAVSMSNPTAAQWGWFQVQGSAVVTAATAAAALAGYVNAAAGSAISTVVATNRIDGMVFKTANGTPAAGQAVAQISWPSANGNG